jgi:predicted nucleotide-binding protein (sugar kinase/HSP70/actin superfamily)
MNIPELSTKLQAIRAVLLSKSYIVISNHSQHAVTPPAEHNKFFWKQADEIYKDIRTKSLKKKKGKK